MKVISLAVEPSAVVQWQNSIVFGGSQAKKFLVVNSECIN